MKVVDKRKEEVRIRFKDLPIGQTYLDVGGNLAIKTNFSEEDNCITLYNKDWHVYTECLSDEVTPIEATLTLE